MRLSFIFIFLIISSAIAQDKPVLYQEGQIYLKVKPQFSNNISISNKSLSLSRELPVLNALLISKNKTVLESTKPFLSPKNKDLKDIIKIKIDDSSDLKDIIAVLKASGIYEYVERVPIRKIIAVPNDPSYEPSQWSLKKIKASEAWDINVGINNVIVAVVDNAIQTNHVDLAANMVAGKDMSSELDFDPNPPNANFSHGSHVSGIVAAVTNNNIGIASAGRNKVKVMPIKATPDNGDANSIYYGFEGILYAADNGARIISCSWGGGGFSNAEQDVINYAANKGCIIVAAAGNDYAEVTQYPASYANVISVASLDTTDIKSSFSTYSTSVDISAPGRGILSTIPFNLYASYSGTSMATPLVSACLGYLISCFPAITNAQVEALLKNTADNIDVLNASFVGKLGAGRVNLLSAVACKTEGLDALSVNVGLNKNLCLGDSTLISLPAISGVIYEWYKDGGLLSQTQNSFYTKNDGAYSVKITKGACVRKLESQKVYRNTLLSSVPSVLGAVSNYCDGTSDTLKMQTSNCIFPIFYEKDYAGGTVGYDGNEQSGVSPSVVFDQVPGFIDSVEIKITWHKKDGGNYNSCDIADGGGIPFNEEVSFGLISPAGKIIDLVAVGTYARGTVTSGQVTTIFKNSGSILVNGSLPVSGSFKPYGSFSSLVSDVANGEWKLIANDDAQIDPLCVYGFGVKVYTNANLSTNSVSWWDSPTGGVMLSNSSNLILNSQTVGVNTFYAQNNCSVVCPSNRVPAKHEVKSIPEIIGFNFNDILISQAQAQEIYTSLSYTITKTGQNLYFISGTNQQSQPFIYQISNSAPVQSPVTICNTSSYILLAMGCSGTVSWSNGETNRGIILENISGGMDYTASCNQAWACTPPPPSSYAFSTQSTNLILSGTLESNLNQSFFGQTINSSQIIKPNSTINFKSPSSILLSPGFSVGTGNVFKAVIGGCE